MDSDEDDEPQNEPGTSSNTQHIVPVLPLRPGSAASSRGPSARTNSGDGYTDDDEHGDRESGTATQSAQSHDSGRTVHCPDPDVLTSDEQRTVTPETHKCAAAHRSLFCDHGKRRTTGFLQLDCHAVCAAVIVPR